LKNFCLYIYDSANKAKLLNNQTCNRQYVIHSR